LNERSPPFGSMSAAGRGALQTSGKIATMLWVCTLGETGQEGIGT